ncbi:MAG: ribose transport system ATP-binding protein [Thermoleophilaceae bacterium]|jgi:ABC-type sugar transport system ATPase subunit|nr:ribose transport system ATP-binding protein [Thermoleophilaceae bacterium]
MSKTFPGQRALSDFSLEIKPGEIHGLVGENGSGKSTFIKCLAGYHQPDHGAEVEVNGGPLPTKYAPSQARAFGLTFVHQDLGLIPTLSVAENLALGRGFATGPGGWIRWRVEQRRARALLARVTDRVSPRVLVRDLSRADQTFVALARVMQDDDMTVAVFDEPTAALTAADIPRLFAAIRELSARGVAVIYVSHRLAEILDLTERVTVLRDGHITATFPTNSVDQEQLVRHIVGRDSVVTRERPLGEAAERTAAPALSVSGLTGAGVEDVSLDIYPGEIVGLAGLLGSGRTELANLLFGVTQSTAGTIRVAGEQVTIKQPADAIRHGIALVPEDRLSLGSFQTLSVSDNVTLLKVDKFTRFARRLSRSRERRYAQEILEEFQVRPRVPERQLRFLSGGNQQKAILGKWMHEHPRVLILDEPTQGIDIGAKAEVARLIQRAARAGVAVLVIDSELENLVTICDRIAVMREGQLVDELDAGSLSRERILQSAFSEKVVQQLERLEQGV